jgi:hypothetical protein
MEAVISAFECGNGAPESWRFAGIPMRKLEAQDKRLL